MIELAVGYIRVSTEDQTRHSPKSQYQDIKNYIDEKGWRWGKKFLRDKEIELDKSVTAIVPSDNGDSKGFQVEGFFVESGSGWEPKKRPIFQEMIQHIRKNNIRHVLFCYVDRIARNLSDYLYFCDKLKGIEGIFIHIVNEDLVFSPFLKADYKEQERLENRLVTGKAESGRISQRVIKAREGRFEEGRVTYRVPFGYINKVDPVTRRPYVESVPDEAETVKNIFNMIESGKYSLLSLTKKLEKIGLKKRTYDRKLKRYIDKPFTRSFLYYLLKNNTYLGIVKLNGLEKKSDEVPQIIDQHTFDKVSEVLKDKCNFRDGRRKKGRYNSPLAHLCKCYFCDCQITTDFTPKENGKNYVYLRCTSGKVHRDLNWYKRKFGKKSCPQPYNTESGVEKAFDEEIKKLFLGESMIAWLEQELMTQKDQSQDLGAKVKKDLEKKLKKLEERKKQLSIMRADNEFTKEEYLEARNETLDEINALQKQIKEIESSSTNIEDEIEITIGLLKMLPDKWSEYTIKEKAELLQIMTKKIVLGENGKNKPVITWEKPWDMIIKLNTIVPVDRAIKHIESMGNDGDKKSPIGKNWCAREDLNPRPLDSKSTALSTELRAHVVFFYSILRIRKKARIVRIKI